MRPTSAEFKVRRWALAPEQAKRWVAIVFVTTLIATFAASCRQMATTRPASMPGMSRGDTTAPSTEMSSAAGESRSGESPSNISAADPLLKVSDAFVKPLPGFHYPPAPRTGDRSDEAVTKLNTACLACHTNDGHTDSRSMHVPEVSIACIDCHGGNWNVPDAARVATFPRNDPQYLAVKNAAHVRPTHPELWPTSANPKAPGAATLAESADYIRFVNPGDLRAAQASCGACHGSLKQEYIVEHVHKSMMATGPMLWEAALYNNGAINRKIPIFGESYAVDGTDQAVFPATKPPAEVSEDADPFPAQTRATPTAKEVHDEGLLAGLFPLLRWEISQPGNVLRVFERGARRRPIIGIPDPEEDAGKPDSKLSLRGFGTDVRTDPVFLGLQKTRLLDPTLSLFGTNDHPGDYRGSGCTACHVLYANDRETAQSAAWSKYGNRGQSFSSDITVNPPPAGSASTQPITEPTSRPTVSYWDPEKTAKVGESGHPIHHAFVKSAPSQTCIVCHIHPGTNVVNAFLGYQWWDNESDGEFMYPKQQKNPTPEQEAVVSVSNPEAAATRGLWSNLYPNDESHAGLKAGADFLENVYRLNPLLKYMQFGDFHGHGWVFRKVYRLDRQGNMLDRDGNKIAPNDAEKFIKAVHLKDIHLEKGMHCVDCHFAQDTHGDGNLYGETRNATMEQCIDCHGTSEKPAAIFSYLDAAASDDDDKKATADKFLQQAFTGNAAFAGLDREKDSEFISTRNRKIIKEHFAIEDGKLIQKSGVYDSAKTVMEASGVSDDEFQSDAYKKKNGLVEKWTVTQAADPITAAKDFVPGDLADRTDDAAAQQKQLRARRALYAHTVRRGFDSKGNPLWGGDPAHDQTDAAHKLAHPDSEMSCYSCHSAWNTSCFGCHLPMRANQFKPMLHNEGQVTRNYTNYNFQTLRDDIYMLGIDSTVKDHKVVPVRSACAVQVSSQDANRQWIYNQQQTVSAEGLSGTAFSPYFPHTVRAAETKQCTDCHLSQQNDNNAIMAQLLMQGTHAVNFIGKFAYVAEGDEGLQAVVVTEQDEPQAVIGSKLHSLAYPDNYARHIQSNLNLAESYEHKGTVLDVQLRGEYLYAACGENGFIAYDVANIDNKGFSERISTAPVSPFGQRLYVKSKYATSIYSPSTMAIDPTRSHLPANDEGVITPLGSQTEIAHANIPALYAYLYLTDAEEGLIVVGNPPGSKRPGVSTLLDGDPTNNFLQRATDAFNPNGVLTGARHMVIRGHDAYICCNAGIVVVDLSDPIHPRYVTTVWQGINSARKIAVQFRYAFVCDNDGLKVLDVTSPEAPRLIPRATVRMANANDIYISRTYGYIAAGPRGLGVIDLTNPELPGKPTFYNPGDALGDARAVRVAMTNASMYAYVAAGAHGLVVLQLTAADADTPGYLGFSPKPAPRLIARYQTPGPAMSLSAGLDRDRAVDEDGNQLSVFGRRGARPFDLEEQQRLYLTRPEVSPDHRAMIYKVANDPTNDPLPAATQPSANAGP